MVYLKSCPRCKGALYLDRDRYGVFLECLQCGHIIDVAVEQRSKSTGRVVAGLQKVA